MKRIFVAIIAIMLFMFAFAEGTDWSSYTEEELYTTLSEMSKMITGIKAELASRVTDANGQIIAYNKDGHKLVLSNMQEGNSYSYNHSVHFDTVYENNSDGKYKLVINGSYINGWDTGALGSFDTEVGRKKKDYITISLDKTDITSIDEIETIELVFGYLDEQYSFTEFEPVVVYSSR